MAFKVKERTKKELDVSYKDITASEFYSPEDPFDKVNQVVETILTMPYRMMRDMAETVHKARIGAGNLRVGPMGEGGEWLTGQVEIAQAATESALLAFGGSGGTGPARIGIKEAVVETAEQFKSLIKEQKGKIFPGQAEAFRATQKGTRQLPKGFLKPVKEINLYDITKMDFSKGQRLESFGTFDRITDIVNLNLNELAKRSLVDPTKAKNTLFHEVGHALQKRTGLSDKYGTTVREIHMQMFADSLEMTAKGEKISSKILAEVFKRTWEEAKVAESSGETSLQVSKMIRERRKIRREEKWENFLDYDKVERDFVEEALTTKSLSKDAFKLGREIHAGEVGRAEVEGALKAFKKLEMDPMEKATRGQFFGEALEFSEILGGKPSGKIGFLKKIGELPKSFGEKNIKQIDYRDIERLELILNNIRTTGSPVQPILRSFGGKQGNEILTIMDKHFDLRGEYPKGKEAETILKKIGKVTNLQEKRLVKTIESIQETLLTGELEPMKAPQKWLDYMDNLFEGIVKEAEKSGDLKEQLRGIRLRKFYNNKKNFIPYD